MMKKLVEIALFTEDVAGLSRFYESVLGGPPYAFSTGYAAFMIGEVRLLIHEKSPSPGGPPPNEDHFALGVEDVDQAAQELSAQGIQIDYEPRDYEWGRSTYLRDPDGRMVELHQDG
jgi:predicted enzyme related to lactoylglutathione lyase